MTKEKSEIVGAIAQAMGSIGKLGKENKNSHGNYQFTSIDDFMAATSKACSEAGIAIMQDETSLEVIDKGNKQWLKVSYVFTVHHSSGETMGPFTRSVAVMFTGAQAFGAAQSYALKQFMRSTFQIATGDADDPDYDPPTNDPPAIVKEPVTITDDTVQDLYAIIDPMEAFATQELFREWVSELMGVDIHSLTDGQGKQTFKFLQDNPNVETWPERSTDAYEAVMARAAKSAEESPV